MEFLDILYLKFIPLETLRTLKIISGFVSLFFVVSIIFFIKSSGWMEARYGQDFKNFFSFKPSESRAMEKKWNKINQRLKTNLESEYKLAILEADILMNEVINKMGYKGKTSSERLQKVTTDFLPSINEIIEAHKVRNNIIHDPRYKINHQKAQEVISVYGKAFKELYLF